MYASPIDPACKNLATQKLFILVQNINDIGFLCNYATEEHIIIEVLTEASEFLVPRRVTWCITLSYTCTL